MHVKYFMNRETYRWKKRVDNNNSLFVVPRCELCELVGLYGLKNIFGLGMVGLYSDGGLTVQMFLFQSREIRKQAYFKYLGLRTTLHYRLLRCELNLNDILYFPYKKENLSHPKNTIKQMSNIINESFTYRSSKEEKMS